MVLVNGMKNKILKLVLLIALIIVAVYAINLIRGANKGTPTPNTKGSPFDQN